MVFRRIDQKTINCIISKEDLEKCGVELDDILMHKTESLQSLKDAITRAAVKENLNIDGNFNTMQCSVLRDNSISLTLSQDRKLPGEYMTKTGQELLKKAQQNWQELSEKGKLSGKPETTTRRVSSVYIFFAMADVIDASKAIPRNFADKLDTSLYFDEKEERYYLIVNRKEDLTEKEDLAAVSLLNEYASEVERHRNYVAAYVREHAKCILKNEAIQTMRAL